ncbi:MAG: hypothetical protein GY865_13395 [candidate division Zixibacteria bacterium]|nr:hypothetical protein [candidate division Zixibacteria bacterium]
MKKPILLLSILILISCINVFGQANDTRRDYLSFYDDKNWPLNSGSSQAEHDSINAIIRAKIADRYDFGIDGSAKAFDDVVEINPDFGMIDYNSFQSNFVTGEEHKFVMHRIDSLGGDTLDDPLYLHYYDNTYSSIGGTILGWDGEPGAAGPLGANATALKKSDARVFAYTTARGHCNYSTAEAREHYLAYVMHVMKLPHYDQWRDTSVANYNIGICWDNATPLMYNVGSVSSGGHVLEHPTHARIDSLGQGKEDWWYDYNMKPFFQELMDSFAVSSTWMPNGNPNLINMLNIVGSTLEGLAVDSIATHLFFEFGPSITKHRRYVFTKYATFDSLCDDRNVSLCYSPSAYTGWTTNSSSEYTKHESMHGNLAWFYVSRSDSAMFFQQGTNSPSVDRWDSVTWVPSMNYDIGEPTEHYVSYQSGTDGNGASYEIYKRNYDNGIALIRPCIGNSEKIDTTSAMSVDLGGTYYELLPNGTTTGAITSIFLRNAQGRIVIPNPIDSNQPIDSIPPAKIEDLRILPNN